MISAIKGKLIRRSESSVSIEREGLTYEVFIPIAVFNELKDISEGEEVSLFTFHYCTLDPSKSFPVLIGFMNEIEKEFFEKFITVSGVGPKAAVRAINKPISEIAKAIDRSDVGFLRSLPGIGEQRAKEIIAKLQDKVGKFALIQDGFKESKAAEEEENVENEAIQVLMQLQYKRQQAQEMVKKAIQRRPDVSSSEELLNEVYKQKKV